MATESGQPYNQPNAFPTMKLTAAAVGGAIATILVVLANTFLGVSFPAGFEGAVAVVVSFILGYFVKERPTE